MVCGFIHLALAIMLCFLVPMSGIYELIDVSILFCALAQCNFCCLIMYIVTISINFFTYFSVIGLWIQTGAYNFGEGTTNQKFGQTVICLLTIYYLVAVFVCFCAYREFKAMVFDAGMGGGFGMGGMMNRGQPAAGGDQAASGAGGGGPSGGRSYQGNGVNIGGGQSVSGGGAGAGSSSQPSGGGFKAFQGKGVQIGGS